ncbi:MAG: hypothetical protein GY866_03305 [Proteobacteria bacterium]|nr:hypothetical protein [Pseudomonadota bacterium]
MVQRKMIFLVIHFDSRALNEVSVDLERRNHEVLNAFSASEVWNAYARNSDRLDAVIIDIGAWEPDGLRLLRQIRGRDFDIPVVLAVEADSPVWKEALKFGGVERLQQPFESRQLDSILARIRSRKTNRQTKRALLKTLRGEIAFEISSRIEHIDGVVSVLEAIYLPICRLYRQTGKEIGLCLTEALNNAVVHGNLEVDSTIKEASWRRFQELVAQREVSSDVGARKIHIRLRVFPKDCSMEPVQTDLAFVLEFTIEDQGNGFDHSGFSRGDAPAIGLTSGRGLVVMSSLMDEIAWNEAGNHITMRKFLVCGDT